jgi:hypothetical protein
MRNKDDDAKQTQDYRDYFNHFDAPLLLVRVATDAGFMPASSGPKFGHSIKNRQ